MADDWKHTKLGEVLGPKGYIRGPFGSALKRGELQTSGIPVYEQQHAIYGTREFRFFIDDEKYRELSRFTVRPNDLIVSCSGTLGRVSIIHDDDPIGIISQALLILRPDIRAIDPSFLFYILSSPAGFHSMVSVSTGSVQVNIAKRSIIEDIDILLPPLREQKAIAADIGVLDDKIDLNRRMNATLEAMARTLFQSWFVDFDPIRTKESGSHPVGLDKLTAALFPTQFQNSHLGKIPQGWGIRSLYETARFINGAAFKSSDFCSADDGLPVIKIAELKEGVGPQTKFSQRKLASDQMIEAGDLLYSWSGSPDTSLDAFIWTASSGLLNQHIFKVVTSNMAQRRFVYYLLKYLRSELIEIARNKQTTGLGHVTVADMKRLLVCYPPEDVLAAFDSVVAALYDRSFSNQLESRTLANLRDILLPRLLRGALRVPGVDAGSV